ncbi:MAG: efflux RND transporter periplasmic adaptor subunit [Acidobacteriota bacterium]
MIKKYRHVLVALLTALGAVYLAADSNPSTSTESAGITKRVIASAVEAATDVRELRFSGVTQAADRARLAFSVGGRLTSRPVDVGDRVSAGQVLAKLDARELDNAVATARGALEELTARLAQAERDLARAEQLASAKAATSEEVEKARSDLDALRASRRSATARVRETERLRGEASLVAPYAGTVTEVHYETGEYATPGRPVVVLSGDGDLELEVQVPETVVPRIRVGDGAQVRVPYLGESVDATIESVGRTAAGPGSLFPVTAALPASAELVAGATAELVISLSSDAALAVPVEAVINPGGRRPALFRLSDRAPGGGAVAQKIFVEVGTLLGDHVVVRSEALAVGDVVVVGGQRGLLDGEEVEIVEGEATGRGLRR